jgi:type IV secretion system protein VirB10
MVHPAAQPSAFPPAVSGPDTETQRLRAPLMVVDLGDGGPAPVAARAVPGGSIPSPDDAGRSAEERFAARVSASNVETSRATRLHDLAHIIPQGTVIPAVLETAINSDLPGSTRAIVSRDVRSFDGSQILIPRGSTLIGQYRNGVAYGQHRAFVIWSRVLTPDGVSIDIGSPGTDPLGRGGLSGETDTHFFQRFGSSILLSVLSAGVAAVSRGGSDTAIIIGSPLQAQTLASQTPKNDIPVTVKVMQGTPMSVFLTRDLDFSDVVAAQ